MTPALKAMVEAMGREFLRQTEESEEAPVCQFEAHALRVTDVYGGQFDLEKVARAGLEAVKPAPTEVLRAVFAPSGAPGADLAQHEAIARDWNTSIGAILGEKP